MSLPKTASVSRRTALIGLTALAGCGFTPVYGTRGAATPLRGAVAFEADESLEGYRLRERLERRLGTTSVATYTLTVKITVDENSVAISSDDTILRTSLTGHATYSLQNGDGTVLTSGGVESFTGYSNTGNAVSTRSGEEDARERLAVALADLVVAELLAFSPNL